MKKMIKINLKEKTNSEFCNMDDNTSRLVRMHCTHGKRIQFNQNKIQCFLFGLVVYASVQLIMSKRQEDGFSFELSETHAF